MIHEFSCLGQLPPITQIEQSRSKPLPKNLNIIALNFFFIFSSC